MTVDLQRLRRSDAGDLIAANGSDVAYHAPWMTQFTDQAGFDTWFARGIVGANVSLVARGRPGDGLIGVVDFTEILLGALRSAYAAIGDTRCKADVDS